MAIKYVEGMRHSNSAKYAVVDIQDIYLDEENPRFASTTLLSDLSESSQLSIINYLIEYANVMELAESISTNKGLYNEDIASAYLQENKVIVLEGNRRITACKILLDNSLINEELKQRFPIPPIDFDTKENLKKVNLIIYDESADAQKYIASKHTQPDIRKWSTIEQYNYYFSQFKKGKKIIQIADEVSVKNTKSIEIKIRDYILFRRIFEIVKRKYFSLHVETAFILPVVSQFMPKLLNKNTVFGLELEFNQNTLEYISLDSQEDLYNQILLLIGEAFFARPEAKKKIDLDERPKNDKFRISTDEIKGKDKVNQIIEKDIRIPGLKALILKFRNEFCENVSEFPKIINKDSNEVILVNERGFSLTEEKNQLPDRPTMPDQPINSINGSLSKNIDQKNDFTQLEKQISFFADLEINHLNPTKIENHGLIAVAKEIKKISQNDNYTAYYKYPIASTFLLRSLIEQVVVRQLKSSNTFQKFDKNSTKATPELGTMISKMCSNYSNGNIENFNGDKQLGKDFNATFTGGGTKDQLDSIIHRPAECQPNKIFLDNMANSGLRSLIQKMIDLFE